MCASSLHLPALAKLWAYLQTDRMFRPYRRTSSWSKDPSISPRQKFHSLSIKCYLSACVGTKPWFETMKVKRPEKSKLWWERNPSVSWTVPIVWQIPAQEHQVCLYAHRCCGVCFSKRCFVCIMTKCHGAQTMPQKFLSVNGYSNSPLHQSPWQDCFSTVFWR